MRWLIAGFLAGCSLFVFINAEADTEMVCPRPLDIICSPLPTENKTVLHCDIAPKEKQNFTMEYNMSEYTAQSMEDLHPNKVTATLEFRAADQRNHVVCRYTYKDGVTEILRISSLKPINSTELIGRGWIKEGIFKASSCTTGVDDMITCRFRALAN